MQISGRQAATVCLVSYAVYEASKGFLHGTSYTSVAKIALTLLGTAALQYTNRLQPKKKVSNETLEQTKRTLEEALQSDSIPKEVEEMFQAVEETFGLTAENLIPPGQDEMKIVMDTPIMWGISKQGNPYLCLLINTSLNPPYEIFVFSVQEDGIRGKNKEHGIHDLIPFSAITSGRINVEWVKKLICGVNVPYCVNHDNEKIYSFRFKSWV